jgi:putative redox protein
MEMEIVVKDGDRVEAIGKRGTIATDQDGSAPRPFDMFLASIGTCAGFYVAKFCRQRNIPTDDIRICQRMTVDPSTKLIRQIDLDVELPDDFPEKYRAAVVRAAESCSVKKHLATPPAIEVKTTTRAGAPSV